MRWEARRRLRWGVAIAALIILVLALIVPFTCGRFLESVNRVPCASNLRQIGHAILVYASKHNGHLPDDLPTLIETEDLSPNVFCCPNTSDVPAAGPTTQAIMTEMKKPGTVSYLYLGKGLTSSDLTADVVLAYEPLSNHQGRGMNVLFGDGHVEWVQGSLVEGVLSQAKSPQRPASLPSKR